MYLIIGIMLCETAIENLPAKIRAVNSRNRYVKQNEVRTGKISGTNIYVMLQVLQNFSKNQ